MTKLVLGFSGGVDSAVSAMLLRQAGYDVVGVYLDNTGERERNEAITSARRMELPLHIVDVKAELEEKVCTAFCESYLQGQTPNPCILCNPLLKFRNLLAEADRLGAQFIATGHYARAEGGALYKGMPSNDQSYMLCRLTREQAARLILPLGGYEKSAVRAMAGEMGLDSAQKPDSMEICFIPDKDYVGWMAKRVKLPSEGDFIFHGQVIGRHQGIHRYTVGQRRPGLYNERKLYISRIDAETNSIQLALWEELFKTEVYARDFNWLIDVPTEPIRASVRVRHTKWENPDCTVYVEGDGVKIICDEPVRAPAAGQSAVLYMGDRLIGGGFIVNE